MMDVGWDTLATLAPDLSDEALGRLVRAKLAAPERETAPLTLHKLAPPTVADPCEAVIFTGYEYARCRLRASTDRDGHRCCGHHVRVTHPHWVDEEGNYRGW